MASPIDTRKFAREQAGRLVGRLAYQVNRTSKSGDSTAVHDLRVAIRRFHRLLKVYEAAFDGKETRKLRRRLKRVLELAHAVGRYDGALKVLAKSPGQDGAGFRPKLQNRRKEAARDLTGSLRRWMERKSSLKWRSALDASLTRQGDVYQGISVEQIAADILPGMAKDFFHAGNDLVATKAPAPAVEDFRIACRKFRYTLELFAPIYSTKGSRWMERVRETQVLLGAIRDFRIVEELISPYKGADDLAGWLKKRQKKQRAEFRRYWRKEFGDPKSVREWIDSLGGPLKKPMGRSLGYGREKVSLPSSR